MKKRVFIILCGLLLLPSVVLAAGGMAKSVPLNTPQKTLRIFNWTNYIDQSVLDDFTRTTSINILYNEYDDNATLDSRLMLGKADYDLVVPTAAPYLQRQVKANLFIPLDKTKLPNFKNLDPQLLKLVSVADPENKHAIIYQWGTTGILFNAPMVTKIFPFAPVDSLDLVFNPDNMEKLKECGVAFLDSPSEVMPLVMRYLHYAPDTQDPLQLMEAEKVLKKIRPFIKYFHSARYVDDIANGSICVALGWNGDAHQAQERALQNKTGQKISYSLPKEGSVVWFDTMAIPKAATNIEEAYQFMNYILQPQIMARISNKTGYANAVTESHPFLDKDLLAAGTAYPDDGAMKTLFTVGEVNQDLSKAWQKIWTRMRVAE